MFVLESVEDGKAVPMPSLGELGQMTHFPSLQGCPVPGCDVLIWHKTLFLLKGPLAMSTHLDLTQPGFLRKGNPD